MDTERDPDDDPIARTVLSGSAYERVRVARAPRFPQSIATKLAWQSALLGGLVLLLPLYALFPATVAGYLPAADPGLASPRVIRLGLVGAAVELFAATLLVGAALYRIRNYPLSERQATVVLDVEEFSAYLGFGVGGTAIGLTVAYFLLGLGGARAVEGYVAAVDGINPFAASGIGLSVADLAAFSFVGSLVLLALWLYLQSRLVELDTA